MPHSTFKGPCKAFAKLLWTALIYSELVHVTEVNAGEICALVGMCTGCFIMLFYTLSRLENVVDGNIPAPVHAV